MKIPTSTIDGQDVATAAEPSGEIGCRLDPGGVSSVEQLRRCLWMQRGRR